MTKLKLNVNWRLFKSWVTMTVIWVLVMGVAFIVGWTHDLNFCLKFIPDQFPECQDVATLLEKRPDLYTIGLAVTVLPPIIFLLPILFWSARRS